MQLIRRRAGLLCALLASATLAACATAPGDQNRRSVVLPSSGRIAGAIFHAITYPGVWEPAMGAFLFNVTKTDEPVANWASDHTPLFGSAQAALDASDNLQNAAGIGALVTALTVYGDTPEDYPVAPSLAVRLAVEGAGVALTDGLTSSAKSWVGRQRPHGGDNKSFPSAHSSRAFGYSTFARKNLEDTEMNGILRGVMDFGFFSLAAGTAWARVEGGVHYPSDVLAGAALGNFTAVLLHDIFLGPPGDEGLQIVVRPLQGGGLALAIYGQY